MALRTPTGELPAIVAALVKEMNGDVKAMTIDGKPGTRFVVSFADAPLGTYPYVVRGNGAEGQRPVGVAEEKRYGRGPALLMVR